MSAETANSTGAEGGIDLLGAAVSLGSSWITAKNNVKQASYAANAALNLYEQETRARDDMIRVGFGVVLLIIVGTIAYKKMTR